MADKHYIGIVARKSNKYQSGYEVADHVRNADTLVKAELYSGEVTYHPLNLPKEKEKVPGQKVVEDNINKDHTDLNRLVTGGRTLKYKGLKEGIINEVYESGKDVYEVIDNYKKKYAYQKAA